MEKTTVVVNGVKRDGYDHKSLVEVLDKEGFNRKQVAVEINGEIISKSLFEETTVQGGDCIEVVSFVGGG